MSLKFEHFGQFSYAYTLQNPPYLSISTKSRALILCEILRNHSISTKNRAYTSETLQNHLISTTCAYTLRWYGLNHEQSRDHGAGTGWATAIFASIPGTSMWSENRSPIRESLLSWFSSTCVEVAQRTATRHSTHSNHIMASVSGTRLVLAPSLRCTPLGHRLHVQLITRTGFDCQRTSEWRKFTTMPMYQTSTVGVTRLQSL